MDYALRHRNKKTWAFTDTMTLKCPSCGSELKNEPCRIPPADVIRLWCSIGRCPSEAANNGATGATIEEALSKLRDAVDEEEMQQRSTL